MAAPKKPSTRKQNTKEIAKTEDPAVSMPMDQQEMSVRDVVTFTKKVHNLLNNVLKENVHYGKIPGAGDKKSLWQPGADKICLTFRFRPEFEETVTRLEHNHIDVSTKCCLYHIPTGTKIAESYGSCSTLESKYRYRTRATLTHIKVPPEYWKKKDPQVLLSKLKNTKVEVPEGAELGTGKSTIDGTVYIAVIQKHEHENIGDLYNTVRKMSQKRSFTSATQKAVAASDLFTTDIEDLDENATVLDVEFEKES